MPTAPSPTPAANPATATPATPPPTVIKRDGTRQRYVKRLFEHIEKGDLDPSYLLTHKWALDDAPQGYRMFKDKADDCMRVVFAP